MFDWLEFDEATRKEIAEQEKRLGIFLKRYFDKYSKMREMPIFQKPSQEALNRISSMEIPKIGRDSLVVGEELINDVFEKSMLIQHPRFYSFVASAVSPYSLAGSILSDIYNLHGGGFEEAPGACLIEENLIRWMGKCAGYPEDKVGGVFLSGGSMANMTAMVAARDSRLDPNDFNKGVVYFSDQTHSSNEKGLRIIGFRKDQLVKIPTDENFKIRTDYLEEAIRKDIEIGRKPFAIIGNLGTTNTGSIDPLDKIGDIAKKYNLWFHIDGAYGASILLSKTYSNLAKGIEKSDSFSWDTHKWLMQTYSCSSIIVKNKQDLLNSFTEQPEYLADVSSGEHCDAWNLGPEMTRPHRAIKLWYTVQSIGTDVLSELIDYSFYSANLVEKELNKLPNWRIMSKPCCGTINFRYELPGMSDEDIDKLTDKISQGIINSGFAYIVTTKLLGKKTLRMCILNANTMESDILQTINLLNEIAISEAAKFQKIETLL